MVRLLLQFYPCLAIVERRHVIHRRTGFEEDVLAAVVGWLHCRAQHWEVIGIRRDDGVGAAVRRTVAPVVPFVPFIGGGSGKPACLQRMNLIYHRCEWRPAAVEEGELIFARLLGFIRIFNIVLGV